MAIQYAKPGEGVKVAGDVVMICISLPVTKNKFEALRLASIAINEAMSVESTTDQELDAKAEQAFDNIKALKSLRPTGSLE